MLCFWVPQLLRQVCVRTQLVSTGADGLVKLWGVRSAECTATFDEHEGKVPAPTAPCTMLQAGHVASARVPLACEA